MKRDRSEKFCRAMRLLDQRNAQEALLLADELIASEDEGDRLAGYFCRGAIYEDGGEDLLPDIDKAIHSYRQASLIVPDAVTFGSLARMSMKKGGDVGYSEALRFLTEAAKIEETPEVILGYAEYFKTKPSPNYAMAKLYYRRAAKEGRVAGLTGLMDVYRLLDQPIRAMLLACLTIILAPIFLILLGQRSRDVF